MSGRGRARAPSSRPAAPGEGRQRPEKQSGPCLGPVGDNLKADDLPGRGGRQPGRGFRRDEGGCRRLHQAAPSHPGHAPAARRRQGPRRGPSPLAEACCGREGGAKIMSLLQPECGVPRSFRRRMPSPIISPGYRTMSSADGSKLVGGRVAPVVRLLRLADQGAAGPVGGSPSGQKPAGNFAGPDTFWAGGTGGRSLSPARPVAIGFARPVAVPHSPRGGCGPGPAQPGRLRLGEAGGRGAEASRWPAFSEPALAPDEVSG